MRYCPERPFPPYTYISGRAPHPHSDPAGHSFGQPAATLTPPTGDLAASGDFRYAVDLFNHGFYWEAHEAWEGLWQALGRTSPAAMIVQGLIKLAAAGVKAYEGRPAGVERHARRAIELLTAGAQSNEDSITETRHLGGRRIAEIVSAARDIAAQANELCARAAYAAPPHPVLRAQIIL